MTSSAPGFTLEFPEHRRLSDSKTLLSRHTPNPSYDSSMAPSIIQEIGPDNFLQQSSPGAETHSTAAIDSESKMKRSTLNTIQLATIIFYSVSGGPFGIEESVRAAGPFYTLVGFAIAPFVFSLPECLMTVELSAGGFKSSAAGAAWVEEAFGSRAGFMAGFLSYVSGATDNAIYPVLFIEYALQVFPTDALDAHSTFRFFLLTSISVGLAYMNWLGLDFVGNMSILICCLAMSPFVLLVIFGGPKVDTSLWFQLPPSTEDTLGQQTSGDDDTSGGFFPNFIIYGVMLRPFLNNLFWNFNSFDSTGCFAEDIDDPITVLPSAMFIAWVMVGLGYLLPLLVAFGTTDVPPNEWVDGYLATVVYETVGPWLAKWLVFAAAVSNLAQFQAELSSDAYMLMGMADRGYLPQLLGVRSPQGTPTYAIMLGTIVIVIMGVSNLDTLIEMLNFNYAISLLMEYAAFIKLRVSKPNVFRPFRIPLSTAGCVIALIPTLLAILAVMALASYKTFLVSIVSNLIGFSIYALLKRNSNRKGYETLRTVDEQTES